MGNIADQDRIG
jgi:hypothetical protein